VSFTQKENIMHPKAINDIKTISSIIRAIVIIVLLSNITYNSVSFGLSILLIAPILNCVQYQISTTYLSSRLIAIVLNVWHSFVTITFGIVYQAYTETPPLNKNKKEETYILPLLSIYIIFLLSERTLTLWFKDIPTTVDKGYP